MSGNRGYSYGGGQSSLGYLFGSDDQPKAPPPPRPSNLPPYGVDIQEFEKSDQSDKSNRGTKNASEKQLPMPSNNYQRTQGQNSGNFITDRPSTKVKSAPGGDSSLGYLFGGQNE